ncbi:Serine/threonine-protein kinase pim-2 [Triplophysa tibetana]|uniref:non-specific serine/threonine protein kinase n=1 Tax=Triplophysa tibetana TaxID=1572043 RepID=A0A5A9PTM3_9TELE|nr:Serine/threonine-protein kinase pim-2 [Triplophysa tibetana]
MGQTFVKCCQKDESSDSSSVYQLPAVAIDNAKEKEGGKKKKNKFLRWIKGRKVPPATETPPVTADRSGDDVISGHHLTGESEAIPAITDPGVPASPDRSVSHSGDDVIQSPVHSAGQVDWDNDDPPNSFSGESDWEQEIEQTPVNQPEEKLEDGKKANGSIEEINSCQYEIGNELGQGGFGTVYEGTRLSDGLKVAVKYVVKDENIDYISIPDYDEPIPREVALLTLASKGNAPEIIQLLDWEDFEKNYIMVLERFTPCADLSRFLSDAGNQIDEKTARVIMLQAAKTAYMCCKRGVFHRDIKLENFLINTDTLQIKLIDFGCGDFLKMSAYTECMGTVEYFGPEYFETGKYYAKSTTVYSLGVLLFTLMCGRFPDTIDKLQMKKKSWSIYGFSKECLSLVEACMRENLKERIPLREICRHEWFKIKHQTDQQQKITESPAEDDVNRLSEGEIRLPLACVSQSEDKKYEWIEEINSCQYGIGKKLGQGGFGTVYEGTRLTDGFKVAVKYLPKDKNTDYISIPGYDKPIPREVALLTLANEGGAVPEIIRLMDWQDCENGCIMVLESFTPCVDVGGLIKRYGGCIDEALARVILRQVTKAAEVCRRRGVFHRDIKLNNLLVDPDTVKVKLIDFGCGDLLKTSTYRDYMGTLYHFTHEDSSLITPRMNFKASLFVNHVSPGTGKYACPEFLETGEYKANPATVYSLGVLLFIMVCGVSPTHNDLYQMNEKVWCEDGLTTECCSLIQSCLQKNPEERLLLENILEHDWFQDNDGVC